MVYHRFQNIPYPKLIESTPHPAAYILNIHSTPILTSMPRSSKWSLYFRLSQQNPVHFPLFSIRATCLAYHIMFDLVCLMIFEDKYKIWSFSLWNFIILLLHPSLVQIFSLEPCSQTPSVYAFSFLRETKFHTRTKKNWQNYGFVHFNLYIPGQKAGRQKTLDRTVTSILWCS
jgi:hypothetical protein